MVSIITPVYNGEVYVDQTSASILGQTFKDYEWIIIDDCSKDNTRDKLKTLAEKDSRIKLIFLEKNSGPIVARNKGLDAAKGDFIAFIDIDDHWLPQKLEKQLKFMKCNDIALSYTGYRKFSNSGKVTSHFTIPVPSKVTYNRLLGSNSIIASTAIYDRRKTGEVRQDIEAPISKDDLIFWLEILKKSHFALGLKEDLCRFRIHKGSITSNKLNMAVKHWHLYRDTFKFSLLKSFWLYTIYSVKSTVKYLL